MEEIDKIEFAITYEELGVKGIAITSSTTHLTWRVYQSTADF